jgi:hypothetical protein
MVERGFDGKGSDSASLKLKAVAKCGDPKMLADAMKSYLGAEDVNTRDCALEWSEFFGSTKRKLNLPPSTDCDSHGPDKVNYSIPHPNTRATRQRIEESLSSPIHGVTHTTSVIVMLPSGTLQDYHPTQPNNVGHYRPLQRLCAMPKLGLENMAHLLQHTKGSGKNFDLPTMWSMNFGFALTTSSVV